MSSQRRVATLRRHLCAGGNSNDKRSPVILSRDGAVAVLQLNDPPMNLFSIATVDALEELLPRLDADSSVRCIVLKGGPHHFSGGANLKEIVSGRVAAEFATEIGTGAGGGGGGGGDGGGKRSRVVVYRGKEVPAEERFIRQRMALVNTVEALRKPVIASILGACVGGGLELALGCTFRIAASPAKIGLPEINRGFPPAWGGTVRLAKTVGKAAAMKMTLLGELLDAEEAERIGLVHEAVADAQALERRTMELAHTLASKAPLAVAGVMEAISVGSDLPVLDGIEVEYKAQRRSAASEDAAEGIRAFLEKRPAKFQGK